MISHRLRILGAISVIGSLLATPGATPANAASASETAAIVAPIDGFVAAILSKNESAMAADFVASPTILDDVPPNSFTGPKAYLVWYRAFVADNLKQKLTVRYLGHGTPHYVHVYGDRAYVVLPADFTFSVEGKPFAESAAWTFVLSKSAGSWKIASWAWSILTDTSE